MNQRDPASSNQGDLDHWDMFADAMDLTIEGHRLIAEEIVYEAKLLWRAVVSWLRDLVGAAPRPGSSPPI